MNLPPRGSLAPTEKSVELDSNIFSISKNSMYPNMLWANAVLTHKKLIVTGGLYGAGTTWTYNVLLRALKLRGHCVYAAYSEGISSAHLLMLLNCDAMLIKAHVLRPSAVNLISATAAPLVIPVRDPRDAVASLMLRFGYGFSKALGYVKRSSVNIIDVQLSVPHKVFKYEDGFIDRVEGVIEVANAAGLSLSVSESRDLFESLRPEKIKTTIAHRQRDSLSKKMLFWLDHDRETHWHKHHIGDGKVGKFRTYFNADQRRVLDETFIAFLNRFNYAT